MQTIITMINENMLEVIAAIAIVTLLIIYLLMKRSEKQDSEPTKKTRPKEEIQTPAVEEKEVIQPVEEPKAVEQEVPAEEIKPVEEVVHVEEAAPVKETAPVKEAAPVSVDRKKRELVPHEKIVKDDFKVFKGVKILVAEDNIINQKVITALLADSGIETIIANDGQEALNILEQDTDFAVILMDAHMPVIDGFQATRLIRANKNYEHIPVIALSGDTAADDIKNMMNVGMEAHLEKPLKMDALYDVLYVYTTGKEDEINSTINGSEMLEFDVEKGLDICGGDKDFYIEILDDFISRYSDSPKKLQACLSNSDAVCADKLLLDISGITANIGADVLHQSALELKNSIASPNDLEYIDKLKNYKRALNVVIDAIKAYKTA